MWEAFWRLYFVGTTVLRVYACDLGFWAILLLTVLHLFISSDNRREN
jgi:hypothetical protein